MACVQLASTSAALSAQVCRMPQTAARARQMQPSTPQLQSLRFSQPSRPSRSTFSGVGSRHRRNVTTMGLFGLGFPELAVIAGVAVLIFGPSKLPEMGKELGKTVKSFQTAAKEFETELKNAGAEDAAKIEGKVEDTKEAPKEVK